MPRDIRTLANKHSLGVKIAGIGLGEVDYIADTITLDARAAHMFDLAPDVALPRDDLHARIHPDDRSQIDQQLSCLLDPTLADFIDVSHRVVHGNGDVLWLNARKQVMFGTRAGVDGLVPVAGMVAIVDVTAQIDAQQHAQYLMEELNHRSKNLLTVVQTIARNTFSSGDADTFIDRFSQRLTGLAHNHDALAHGSWTSADLHALITSHLAAFAAADSPRIQLDGAPVRVTANAAQAIGMALHELATNASKYGCLSNDDGVLRIHWHRDDGPQGDLVLTWEETNGPPVTQITRAGFGQKVIKDVAAASVNGTVDLQYRDTGVYWQLQMPAAEVA